MFPGYLFARFALAEAHSAVRYAHGVSGLVRFGDRYPTVEDEIVIYLQEHTGATEIKEVAYAISPGDQVKVAEGAFAGLEAVVTQVLPAKQRIKVLIEFLGRRMEAEVEHRSVLRQAAHPLAA
jgi:transcriptional antiterminator RfaH